MEKQRFLRCPPDQSLNGELGRIPKLPDYKYTQQAFRSFTEEEIRSQAGKEALLAGKEDQDVQFQWLSGKGGYESMDDPGKGGCN